MPFYQEGPKYLFTTQTHRVLRESVSAFFLVFLLISIVGQNPVISDIGMSDPHMRIFNDTLYLYCGHDNHPDDTTWVMKEWRVFSSPNLLDWNLAGTISPEDNYMDDLSRDCWAGDASSRDGTYYFYFSDRKRGIGVMSSDHPGGPFTDELGKPLISPMHDPTILIEDNAEHTPYMVYGDKEGGFHAVRLHTDMISLAESPRPLTIIGEEWESAPDWMDKNYIFKHGGTYYLSWGRDYATSESIYGPFTCAGAVGRGFHLDEYAHGSFFHWKGQFYHMWCYYLRPGFKYRETIITYCHMDDQGSIVTDTKFLDSHYENGVGQYDASWPEIQAEWYYDWSPGLNKTGNREAGFEISGMIDGCWLKFANVEFHGIEESFMAQLSNVEGEGKIEIRIDSLSGPLLGWVDVQEADPNRGSGVVSSEIKGLSGQRDLYLKVSGDSETRFNLDWFNFSE